ncbi:MAG TPA: hypothetical protein VFG30_38025 [Polyangiales bacterium]|nr:hypothetical protein [Polyangiales bacterium]
MQVEELENAKRLSDKALIAQLTCCVKEDRDVTARLLVHLGEVDARGLFRDLGFGSMFDYAVQALHMLRPRRGSGFEPHDWGASSQPHSQWSREASCT